MNRIPSPLGEDPPPFDLDEPPRDAPRVEQRVEQRNELRLDDDRERMRTGNSNVDPFDITDIYAKYAPTKGDPKKGNINNEIDFNWKRYETYGKRDYAEQRSYYDQGWRPVMHEMFPDRFAPAGTEGPVIVKDMILMERPMRLTVQARNEEMNLATRAMTVHRQKMAEAPEGQAPRMDPIVRTTRETIEIPD
jgi:hypothetical protein